MSWDLADLAGMIGSALMIGGYAYSNVAKAMNFALFNLLNLVGAVLMITSLSVHFNMAAMGLEIIWGLIALFGFIKALAERRRA